MIKEKVPIGSIRNSLVSISRFNRGEATKIFKEVDKIGVKYVLKNNEPISVLMSPSRYEEMMEALEDYVLYFEAEKRVAAAKGKYVTSDEVLVELGISDSDLDDIEVEIE
jgi:PHD/YefM family antitoxin component YafN of YafNO toxin-antitoxin module